MFSIGDLVSLSDGNEFVVVGTASVNEKNYYYMISKNSTNVRFCIEKEENGKIFLRQFFNRKVIEKLFPLFKKSAMDYLAANE